eukprot:jgi/Ulvmu1/952/UM102_0035.1
MASIDVSDELPCSRRFISVTDCDIFGETFFASSPKPEGLSDPNAGHQQTNHPAKPINTTSRASFSPSWAPSYDQAQGAVQSQPCRSASAQPASPSATRSDPRLSPRPHTSPVQAAQNSLPRPVCTSPTIHDHTARWPTPQANNFSSFSNAESLKEVFDLGAGNRSPRTPTQLRRSMSMRPMLRPDAPPSRPVSASPYTSHIESQLRHLEKHCQGLEAQLREASQQLLHSEQRAAGHAAEAAHATEDCRVLAADLQSMRHEQERLSGLLVERDAALRRSEVAAEEAQRERDALREQLERLHGALHDSEHSAAAQAEHMEAHGLHLQGAAQQLQQERDAAARERDAALQHSEEMLGDLRALLAKNQEVEADNEQMARMLVAVRREGEAAAQARDDVATALKGSRTEAQELREQAAEAVRRARDAAAEAAHSQAALRARDADLRDLEVQLSSFMLAKRNSGSGGGRSRRDPRAHLRTASAALDGAADHRGGNDPEQGYSEWVGRLSPRPGLGGWLSGGNESMSDPLTTLPDRGDRPQLTSQSMMEFPEESRGGGKRDQGAAMAALLRSGGDGAHPGGPPATAPVADGPRSRRASTSPPQTLSVREQQELEAELLQLNKQRDTLQAEFDKMPPHGGRTLQQRQRKAAVERDLAAIAKHISSVRLTLRRCGYR